MEGMDGVTPPDVRCKGDPVGGSRLETRHWVRSDVETQAGAGNAGQILLRARRCGCGAPRHVANALLA